MSQLDIYNSALMKCKERFLASATENREPARLLDFVWDTGGVDFCLQKGQWKFALRSRMLDYDPSITPSFGYRRAFEKPSDWLVTSAICSDEYFKTPLLRYNDEAGYIYSDINQIYVRYVSSDDDYGYNLSAWPANFGDYVAWHFAAEICGKLTLSTEDKAFILKQEKAALMTAKNTDAMADPVQFPPDGGWVNSRRGIGPRDRGNRGSLIG